MLKKFVQVLKFVIPLAIIGWLLTTIDPEQAEQLRNQPKRWGLLGVSCLVLFGAVSLTFLRWYLLVRVMSLSLTLRDAFRLSFVGYLANFVSAGSVGGDLFKAVFVAREQPQRRAAAVATILVDRIVGLYALMVLTSLTLLLGNAANAAPVLRTVARMVFAVTVVGGIGIGLILVPGFTHGRWTQWFCQLPKIGPLFERVIGAIRMYRDRLGVMFGTLILSMIAQTMLVFAIFLLAHGLFSAAPTLVDHLTIVPLSCVAGAVPLTPAGLGSFEIAMDELYRIVPGADANGASGVLIALGYRITTILIAVVGVLYFWSCGTKPIDSTPGADEISG